ncbi:hypothetical protein C4D60_Mb10t25290 [Musa balbisiana]|uniref:Uncharacterized protein n=1 Tax=Musa balbisiana TaxID=52838 RepID=A0A4S8IZL9_MUSBA|nr:hypothetical protein C4D60_Mb10t25290 [Musa balbisiana]
MPKRRSPHWSQLQRFHRREKGGGFIGPNGFKIGAKKYHILGIREMIEKKVIHSLCDRLYESFE